MDKQLLYVVAAETSGDVFAAEVIDRLKQLSPELRFRAVGETELAARAGGPGIDISPLNVLGFWEGMKAYGDVRRISSAIAEDILKVRPGAVVLVDSWGLSLRVAQKVRAVDPSIGLIKLIGPQVWASRAGRAKTLAASVDHLLCMHAFEVPYYEPHGLRTTVIGQPALARSQRLDGRRFREKYGVEVDAELLLVLPGSRKAEVERVAPPLIDAAQMLSDQRSDLRVCVAPARNVLNTFQQGFPQLPEDWILLEDDSQRYEAMAAATLALSCSGTVNTELAVQGTPFITGYKIGAISWALLKTFFLKADYITLLNMAAGEMIAREFLQGAMTAEALTREAIRLLDNPEVISAQRQDQDKAIKIMGFGKRSAQDISAEAILKTLAL